MPSRLIIITSPFLLAVALGLAVPNVDDPQPEAEGPMDNFSMNRYLWENRPLLVFSPSQVDPRYQEAAKVLSRDPAPLEERDMVVIHVVHNGMSKAEGRAIPNESARELREVYEVKPEQFAVLLVGKDGTPKEKWEEMPPIEEIFKRIDSMPMRKREIRTQSDDGEDG